VKRPSADARMSCCPTCRREVRVSALPIGDIRVDVYYRHNRPGTQESCSESRKVVTTSVYRGAR
jgi:hypothetical protein